MSEISSHLRQKHRDARHSDILAAAWSLLSERGYAGWTLADLADRAGVSRRTLYLHFVSKEEIAAATVARNMMRTAERVRTLADGAQPLERLKTVLRWFVDRSGEPAAIPVAPIKAEPGLMATVRTLPSYLEAHAALAAALAELVGSAQDAGALTKRYPAEMVAAFLLQVLRGLDPLYGVPGADLGDLLLTLVFDGLGARP